MTAGKHGKARSRRRRVLREATEGDELARRIDEARQRIRPLLPEIDEQTLVTILSSMFRPFGTGKHFFLRRRRDGGFIV